MTVKLLIEHPLGFLSLKGGHTGSFESTLVKMPHCWKSHVTTQLSQCLSVRFDTFLVTMIRTCTMNSPYCVGFVKIYSNTLELLPLTLFEKESSIGGLLNELHISPNLLYLATSHYRP